MSVRIAGLLIALLLVSAAASAQSPDPSRLARSIGSEISLVERDGTVRQGLLIDISADEVTMSFSGTPRTFRFDGIASAERLRDRTGDGALKGLAFGAIVGVLTSNANAGWTAQSMAWWTGIGWALDALQTNRETIYRGAVTPAGAAPGVRFSFRF